MRSAAGEHLRAIGESEAWRLVKSGQAARLTSNRELAQGKSLEIQLVGRQRSCRSHSTLTHGDSVANAEAVDERRNNRARTRVKQWPSVHDTYAVTIHAGKVWVPSAKAATARAKAVVEGSYTR